MDPCFPRPGSYLRGRFNGKEIAVDPATGVPENVVFNSRLAWRLLRDRRVSFFLKLIPLVALAYMAIPNPFPFDDLLVVGLGTSLFLKLCPQPVVREHSERLNGNMTIA